MNMRAAHRQKQRERFLLERFFEAAALPAEITEERDPPDFIVRFEGRLIGVEVTELFTSHGTSGSLLQAQESTATRIVSRAQQIYQASSASPAHVSVCFGPGYDLRNLNRDRTADDLASLVQSLNLTEWQRVDWRPEEFDGPLPQEIAFVHALGVPSFDMAHWAVARAGWAVPLTADAIQSRVEKKSRRLRKYQDAVVETWLVVVADGTRPSQLFDASSKFDPRRILSPFSRTFFYGYPERTVIRLGV